MMTNNSHARHSSHKHNADEIEVMEGSVASHLIHEHKDFNLILQEYIKNTPWWGASAAVHIIFILIMSTFLINAPVETINNMNKIIKLPVIQEDKKWDMTLPREKLQNNALPKEKQSEEKPDWKKAPEDEKKQSDDNEPFKDDKGDDNKFISDKPLKDLSTLDQMGIGPSVGGNHGGPRGGRKDLSGPGNGGLPSNKSTEAGLYWLARHQNPDGSWGSQSFQDQCIGNNHCKGTGDRSFDIGLTGLALLSFTGANYSPGSKNNPGGIRYGEVVAKAATFLKKMQKDNGIFGDSTMLKFMYNQGIAAYAMADLYCVMKEKGEPAAVNFKEPALKGVQFIIDAQNTGKAWRYKPKGGDNDVSVTGWCMMALKAGEEAGLVDIADSVWDGVKSHFDDVTDLNYGGVGYMEKGNIAILSAEKTMFESGEMYMPPSLTAIGMMCRIFMGQKRSDAVISNSASMFIKDDNLPKWDTGKYGKIDYYYWFYTSYALNQFDGPKGPTWLKWEKEITPIIIKNQKTSNDGCENGSWDPIDRWCGEGGRVYATAINVLTLEVYYRLRIVMSGK